MAAHPAVPRRVAAVRINTGLVNRPKVSPTGTLERAVCVRAAAEDPASASEDDVPELEVDAVQEERARKEDARQAQRSYSRGNQRNKEEWEDKIVQVRLAATHVPLLGQATF